MPPNPPILSAILMRSPKSVTATPVSSSEAILTRGAIRGIEGASNDQDSISMSGPGRNLGPFAVTECAGDERAANVGAMHDAMRTAGRCQCGGRANFVSGSVERHNHADVPTAIPTQAPAHLQRRIRHSGDKYRTVVVRQSVTLIEYCLIAVAGGGDQHRRPWWENDPILFPALLARLGFVVNGRGRAACNEPCARALDVVVWQLADHGDRRANAELAPTL